jgi:hypothetical protein
VSPYLYLLLLVEMKPSLGSVPRPGTTGSTGYDVPFVSPVSPFLAQDSFSSSPPNPPPRDRRLRLVLPTLNILDPSLLSLQSSPPPSPQSKSSTSTTTASAISPTAGTGTHLFPFPCSLALGRPYTAIRPGTAPASASFFSSKPFTIVWVFSMCFSESTLFD